MSEHWIARKESWKLIQNRAFLILASFVAACGAPDAQMELKVALPDISQTFMMIKTGASPDLVSVHISTLAIGELSLCVSDPGTVCSTVATVDLKETQAQNGRRFLAATQDVKADAGSAYRVIRKSGEVVSEFRMIDTAADPISSGLSLIDKNTLQSELRKISDDAIKGRLSATPENEAVADWLISHLKRLRVPPAAVSDYRQRFKLSVGPTKGSETSNIVGIIEGSDPILKSEYVVIGAHMDHAGTLSKGYTCGAGGRDDEICNGADDNGSGTIALLNVVKSLVSTRATLKRSVIVIWFTGEEEGLLGSYHYVANPIKPLNKTVYMINMDMVGYMRTNGNALLALGGGSSASGKSILSDIAKKYPQSPIKISDKAGGGSDHVPFMAKGIPGVFLHTGVSNNPNYHKTSDSHDKIDYDGMVVASKVAFETAYRVANTSLRHDLNLTREALVTAEEMLQSCHHLINNPFAVELGIRARSQMRLDPKHSGEAY